MEINVFQCGKDPNENKRKVKKWEEKQTQGI